VLILPSARASILLSMAAAVTTTLLKLAAWRASGSVGLLSDALESLVNLAASTATFWALGLARKPADSQHPYGHSKVEYFASGLESGLIVVASLAILQTAFSRLLEPEPIAALGTGLLLTVVATAINAAVALVLLRNARHFHSIALRTDAHHLLSDVWTSLGVILALALVQLTNLDWLDPLVAILVGVHVLSTGWRLMRESASGLLDAALPEAELQALHDWLDASSGDGLHFHAVRTRVAGSRRFISLHVLVPGHWTVAQGHARCEEVEQAIASLLPGSDVTTHLEPVEEPNSWHDSALMWER
jgi:cation diffusion facilitator family transporter